MRLQTTRAHMSRACLHCHVVKVPAAFDMGPSGRRRHGVCRDCKAAKAAEREQRLAARRTTFRDPRTRRMVRRCSHCRVVKPLATAFAWGDRAHTYHQWNCRTCVSDLGRDRRRARMESDPEWAAHQRVVERERKARQRERNPERARAAQRRYKRKVDADPVRRAERRENQRIAYRLRQERRGRALDSIRRPVNPPVDRESGRVPVPPLVAAIDRTIARQDRPLAEICAAAGVDERTYRGWRAGERAFAQAAVAARVIEALGVLWWDVFDEDVFPEAHEAAKALFG